MSEADRPFRIVVVCELWQGSDSYALARAFRRAGHSVTIVSDETFGGPDWRNPLLKAARRLVRPLIVRDFNRALSGKIEALRPHLVFVCKGVMVEPLTIEAAKKTGATVVLWWPDVSFFAHGPNIPLAVSHYDWIFSTKTFGIADLREKFGYEAVSFMPHAFDPEVHRPFPCDVFDHQRYDCDVSFIGTWSPKKQALLEVLTDRLPRIDLKIWGNQWEKAGDRLKPWVAARETIGVEYPKAIALSRINLGILSEVRAGSSSGDLITARTFHIPACGGFMLHERTDEVVQFFAEGKECALFEGPDELVAKVGYFLGHPDERVSIAKSGRQRCLSSANSVDDRVKSVLLKVAELRGITDGSVSHTKVLAS